MDKEKRITLGVFESIKFPELGNLKVSAKIDTGAYTGAMHCTDVIEEIKGGKKVIHFAPFDHPEKKLSSYEFSTKIVKSSNGSRQKRYSINTVIEIRARKYPIHLTLADRTAMKYPVLIGRRFLRANNFLVDVGLLSK